MSTVIPRATRGGSVAGTEYYLSAMPPAGDGPNPPVTERYVPKAARTVGEGSSTSGPAGGTEVEQRRAASAGADV